MQELMISNIWSGASFSGVMTALESRPADQSRWEMEHAGGDERYAGHATAGSYVDEE
jgi:hypothetical protein